MTYGVGRDHHHEPVLRKYSRSGATSHVASQLSLWIDPKSLRHRATFLEKTEEIERPMITTGAQSIL